jgi:nucleoside-diphosphate-sugar epimerase
MSICPSGAGGKGGPSRTDAIDREAAQHYISASVSSSSVQKFLMVSALSIRRKKAEWWSDEDWEKAERTNMQVMPAYYKAKLAADELLTVLGEKKGFQYIILRPGGLTNGEATGRVALGKTRGWGQVRRADVADVAARLLEVPGARGWFDLLEGEEDVGEAVERVVRDKVDSREGESLEEMEKDIGRIL